jgi:hypothetical protein
LYKSAGLRLVDGRFLWNPIVLEKQDSVSTSTTQRLPWHVMLGGVMLSIARIWALPHSMIARVLSRSDRRQLKRLIEGMSSAECNAID